MKIARYSIRCAMVAFWGLLFFGFLFIPRIRRFFYKEQRIALLAWPNDVDPALLAKFEQETGIKVDVSYFEDYEELFVKLKTTKGEGYDLVMPSDYIIPSLIRERLLKPLDHTKLDFLSTIKPKLRGLYYDPGNRYALPYFWGIFGIGIDKNYFDGSLPPATWRLIFDPAISPSKIGMVQDARELVIIAARYLLGSIDGLDAAALEQVKNLLIEQKKRVVAYTDMRAAYLLASGSCPVVLTISYEIARAMQRYPALDFVIPHEGSFLIIDNIAIPAASTHEQLAYKLINYLYRPDVIQQLVKKQFFYPPTINAVEDDFLKKLSYPTDQQFKKADFFREVIPEKKLNDIWIALKA